jgi:hypothetical protein
MSEYSNQDYAALFTKMKNVMASIGAIEKTGRNTTQNYNYMESDVIVTAIRSAMIENNLAFMVGMPACEVTEIVTKNKGGHERITTRALVHMQMMLLDCDTGCVMTANFSNEALDTSDKAVNKAVTAAKKYWLVATFMVSTKDDDSDKDSHSKSNSKAPPQRANQPHDRQAAGNPKAAQTGANGGNSGNLQSTQITQIKVVKVHDKNWLVADNDIWIPSRQMFRDILMFECEDWTKHNTVYQLPYPVLVWWQPVIGVDDKQYRSGKKAETIKQHS